VTEPRSPALCGWVVSQWVRAVQATGSPGRSVKDVGPSTEDGTSPTVDPPLVRSVRMRGLKRRQSLRKTRSDLRRSLAAADRDFVMDAWQAAEGIFTQLVSLGPLTTLFGRAFAASYADAEGLAGEEVQHDFFIVMMAGYASRTVLASMTEQPGLDPGLRPATAANSNNAVTTETFLLGASAKRALDVEEIAKDPDAWKPMIEPVRHVAFSDFGSVMSLRSDLWAGYVSLATMQLQSSLQSRTVSWRELDSERIEGMLRYGYVLHCLDEALDAEPQLREDSPYASRVPEGQSVPSQGSGSVLFDDQLARLEQAIFLQSRRQFSPDTERQIIGGPPTIVGWETWDSWGEDRSHAVHSCRWGFALRLAELQMLPGASERDGEGWVAIRDFIREVMRRAGAGDVPEGQPDDELGFEGAMVASAAAFTKSQETTEALLALTPGTSSTVRQAAFERYISFSKEEGLITTGLGDHDHRRLMVYGYALSVIRELIDSNQSGAAS
jgi:hypothetical protein